MKLKNFAFAAIMMVCAYSSVAQNDFRNVTWGMDANSVKKTETCKLSTMEQSRIVYECSLADIKGKIIYNFTSSGELVRSKYLLTPVHYSMNYFIKDFKLFDELLTQKYGESVKKSVVSTSIKENVTENDWPALLASGQLRIEKTWSTPKTTILLTLSKTGEKPAIQIDYISKEYSDKDLKEKKALIIREL